MSNKTYLSSLGGEIMPKYATLEDYLHTLNDQAIASYMSIKNIVFEIDDVKERLFAGQVAFYIEKHLKKTFHSSPVIVLSFFDDHVNVFASENMRYKDILTKYKFTEKGTMQIHYDLPLETPVLKELFRASLHDNTM